MCLVILWDIAGDISWFITKQTISNSKSHPPFKSWYIEHPLDGPQDVQINPLPNHGFRKVFNIRDRDYLAIIFHRKCWVCFICECWSCCSTWTNHNKTVVLRSVHWQWSISSSIFWALGQTEASTTCVGSKATAHGRRQALPRQILIQKLMEIAHVGALSTSMQPMFVYYLPAKGCEFSHQLAFLAHLAATCQMHIEADHCKGGGTHRPLVGEMY